LVFLRALGISRRLIKRQKRASSESSVTLKPIPDGLTATGSDAGATVHALEQHQHRQDDLPAPIALTVPRDPVLDVTYPLTKVLVIATVASIKRLRKEGHIPVEENKVWALRKPKEWKRLPKEKLPQGQVSAVGYDECEEEALEHNLDMTGRMIARLGCVLPAENLMAVWSDGHRLNGMVEALDSVSRKAVFHEPYTPWCLAKPSFPKMQGSPVTPQTISTSPNLVLSERIRRLIQDFSDKQKRSWYRMPRAVYVFSS